jgi:hypothetical protein
MKPSISTYTGRYTEAVMGILSLIAKTSGHIFPGEGSAEWPKAIEYREES